MSELSAVDKRNSITVQIFTVQSILYLHKNVKSSLSLGCDCQIIADNSQLWATAFDFWVFVTNSSTSRGRVSMAHFRKSVHVLPKLFSRCCTCYCPPWPPSHPPWHFWFILVDYTFDIKLSQSVSVFLLIVIIGRAWPGRAPCEDTNAVYQLVCNICSPVR